MKKVFYTPGLWLLVLCLVSLGGCAPLTGNKPVSTPSTASPIPSSTQITTSTPEKASKEKSPSPSATPTLPSPQRLTLTSIHMFTSTDGWATGRLPDENGDSLFQTNDGGLHWQNVTPPGILPAPDEAAYFLDLANAWFAVPSPGGSNSNVQTTAMTTYRTTDGGQTWQGGAPLSIMNPGPGYLDFSDPQNGWYMVNLGSAAGSESIEIFRTTDGGIQWQSASLTSGVTNQSTNGSLPFGCIKTGISFVDPSTGWATGSCLGGPIFFYNSSDGGQTWQAQKLTPPPGFPENLFSSCQCETTPPVFISQQNGFLQVSIKDKSQHDFLYVSDDGGTSWTPQPLPATNLLGEPDFITPANGWVTDGNQIYNTQDGGESWVAISKMPSHSLVGNLNFISTTDGWFTDGKQVYITHDGGLTWTAASPAPPPIPLPSTTTPITYTQETNVQTLTTNLTSGTSQGFVFHAAAGQAVYLLKNGDASIEVLDSQGKPLMTGTAQPGPMRINIPKDGDYTTVLYGQGKVTISVYFPSQANASQTEVPIPASLQHITFLPGISSVAFSANLTQGTVQGYLLHALQGQGIAVHALGDVTLAILDSKNRSLPVVSTQRGLWQYNVTQTDSYTLVMLGDGQVTVTVSMPPLSTAQQTPPSQPPVPVPNTNTPLTLPAGSVSTTFTITLESGVPKGYVMRLVKGQQLYVSATGDASVGFLGPGGQQVPATHATQSDLWSVNIPAAGDYTIVIYGQGQSSVKVYAPPPGTASQPSVPLPATTSKISIPAGITSTSFSVQLESGAPQGFILHLQRGQRLYVSTTKEATVGVLGLGDIPLVIDHTAKTNLWSVGINTSGDYTVVVYGQGTTAVTISIPQPPAPQPTPPQPANTQQISIPTGQVSTTFTTTLSAGTPRGYVLSMQKGQRLYVSVSGNAQVSMLGPGNIPLTLDHIPQSNLWATYIEETGNYTTVLSGSSSITVTIYVPPSGLTPQSAVPSPTTSTKLQIPLGDASITFSASITENTPQGYIIQLQKGQRLYVSATGGIEIGIIGPENSQLLVDHAPQSDVWSITAPTAGNYTIVVYGKGETTITVYVPPQ